ncbi:MAG: hypothetical protein V2A73_17105 [Pseudomonadota bacterium]
MRTFVLLSADRMTGVVLVRSGKKYSWHLWRVRTATTSRLIDGVGRVVVERCDLAPDSGFLVWFVVRPNGGSGAYTFLSTTSPWKTVGAWRHASTHGGGGVFLGNRTLWMNAKSADVVAELSPKDVELRFEPGASEFSALFARLTRTGWVVESDQKPYWDTKAGVWIRPMRGGRWMKQSPNGTLRCYYDGAKARWSYALEGEESLLDGWDWADWGPDDQLLASRDRELAVWLPSAREGQASGTTLQRQIRL